MRFDAPAKPLPLNVVDTWVGVFNAERRNRAFGSLGLVEQLLLQVLAFFERSFPADHPFSSISPSPNAALVPRLIMLGSGSGGMQIASQLGLGLAFAAHINPGAATAVLRQYLQAFRPSKYSAAPYSTMSLIVVCAEKDEKAEYLAGPADM